MVSTRRISILGSCCNFNTRFYFHPRENCAKLYIIMTLSFCCVKNKFSNSNFDKKNEFKFGETQVGMILNKYSFK